MSDLSHRRRPLGFDRDAALTALEAELRDAFDCLRRLPWSKHDRPSRRVTAWVGDLLVSEPSPLDEPRQKPAAPSARAIDRMERSLDLLWTAAAEDRTLLAARACGASFRALGERFGVSHTTMRQRHKAALERLLRGTPARDATLGEGLNW